jgi:nucleotide-binding universal stress UspA family protein
MYKTILVTLDTTPSDRTIVEHIKPLAREMQSQVVLLHVADGWAARHFGADAVAPEITHDKQYLEQVRTEFTEAGISCTAELAFGHPVDEIIRWVETHGCDLVAMSTHGHKFLADLFLGETAFQVQHNIDTPVLLLRSKEQVADS